MEEYICKGDLKQKLGCVHPCNCECTLGYSELGCAVTEIPTVTKADMYREFKTEFLDWYDSRVGACTYVGLRRGLERFVSEMENEE